MSELKVATLEQIEFVNSTSIAHYAKSGRDIARGLSQELEFSAHDLRGVLAAQAANPVIAALGMDFHTKVRARKVAKHLKRAAEAADMMAKDLAKLNETYKSEFGPALEQHQRKSQKKFDFNN